MNATHLAHIENIRTRRIDQRIRKGGYHISPAPNGYRITLHAASRMLTRKVHMDAVMEALDTTGRPGTQPGTSKHVGLRATVVANHHTREIITVGYGLLNNPAKPA